MNWNLLWIRTTYKLPLDRQEVLIRRRRMVGVACFLKNKKGFLLNDGTFFTCDEGVEWMDINLCNLEGNHA